MRAQDVYSSNVVYTPLSYTLQETVQQMRQKHIGALVVTENTPSGPCAVGVVADRDMVPDAVAVSASPSQTCVADVMSRDILNIPLDTSLSGMLQETLSSGVRHVDVTSGGVLIGVLSLDDVLGAMTTELGPITRPTHSERGRETAGSVQPPLSV